MLNGPKSLITRNSLSKLIKRYFWESGTRDVLPWTPLQISEAASKTQKKLAIRCRGSTLALYVQDQPVAKFEDATFQEGLVGMVLYGKNRATFHGLLAEEICRASSR